jgi:ABC-type transport system substrate-binding protein
MPIQAALTGVMGAGGAAAAAAIANALKASGAIVRVDSLDFNSLLARAEKPVVVIAPGGFLSKKTKYLFNYGGLYFYCLTAEDIHLPGSAEVISAKTIWIPG